MVTFFNRAHQRCISYFPATKNTAERISDERSKWALWEGKVRTSQVALVELAGGHVIEQIPHNGQVAVIASIVEGRLTTYVSVHINLLDLNKLFHSFQIASPCDLKKFSIMILARDDLEYSQLVEINKE